MFPRSFLLPRPSSIVALMVGFLVIPRSSAQDPFVNLGNIVWTNPGGWTFEQVPGPGDTAVISSGTLTVTGTQSLGRLRLKGGTLTGGGSLNLVGPDSDSEWSGGVLNDITLTIAGGATMEISAPGGNQMTATRYLNDGTTHWIAGDIIANSESGINNYGAFNDTADATLRTSSGGQGEFLNASTGTYTKSSEGDTQFDIALGNNGALVLAAGNVFLDGGGYNTALGTIETTAGTGVFFRSDFTVAQAANLTGSGQFTLQAGTLTLTGDFAGPDFKIEGGTLAGDQMFTNGLTWTGGNLNSEGVTTNGEDSDFYISTPSGNLLTNREIINLGTAYWTNGDILLNSGSEISNQGEFHDTAAAKIRTSSGSLGAFHNHTDAGYTANHEGTTEFDVTFNNDGTLTVSGGNLSFDGGGTNSTTGVITAQTGTRVIFNSDFVVEDASHLEGSGQFTLKGGKLTLDGSFLGSDFEIQGGTLTGTHHFVGGATWTGGVLRDGSTRNGSGAEFIISDAAGNELTHHTFTNDGTVQWQAGDLIANSGSVFSNQTHLNDTADASFRTSSGTLALFNNTLTGSYQKQGDGTTKFAAVFNNDGAVNVDAGTLVLDGGGTTSATGSFVVASTAQLVFDHNYTVADASRLTGLGTYRLAQGTLVLDGVFGGNVFEITGGTLDGNHTFPAGVKWSGGTLIDGLTTNDSPSRLIIHNPSGSILTGRSLNNLGTIDWEAGDLILNSGSTLANHGTFNDEADAKIRTSSGTKGVFNHNNGAIYHKNGAGTTELQVTFNNTDGTLNVNAGTLVLNGGGVANSGATLDVASTATLEFKSSYNINDAASLQGSGTFKLSAGTLTLDGAVGISDFLFAGGTLQGDQTFHHGLVWTNGSFASGTTTNADTSTFSIDNLSGNLLAGRAVDNLGVVDWLRGDLQLNSGATFTTIGTFNDTADARVRTSSGLLGTFTLGAGGTYHKNGAGTTEFDVPFHNTGGTVNVNAGTLILDGGGIASTTGTFNVGTGATLQFDHSYTINDASLLTGAGVIKATDGTFELLNQVQNVAIEIDGATLSGTQSFHQGVTLSAGGFGRGQTTVANNSTLNFSVPGGNTLTEREIYVQPGSTLNWTTGNLNANSGSFILLQGTLNDTADARFTTTSGTKGYLSVLGAYNKNGAGTTEFDNAFNNDGTVTVNAGTLILDGGGTSGSTAVFQVGSDAELVFDQNYEVEDAAALQGSGLYRLTAGALEIDGVISANFNLEGGSMFGGHNIDGILTWSGGTWSSGSTTLAGEVGQLILTGDSHILSARTLINEGTIDWDQGSIFLNNGSTLTNAGTFNDQTVEGESPTQVTRSVGPPGSFTNAEGGTYVKSDSGQTQFNLAFTNAGAIDVSAGTLILAGGGEFQAGSSVSVSDHGRIKFEDDFTIADAANLSDEGMAEGVGFVLADGVLSLSGTLDAGLLQAGGELTGDHAINGSFYWDGGDWADGTTTINASGSVAFSGSDQTLHHRTLNNGGTFRWHQGNLALNDGSTISNTGLWQDSAAPSGGSVSLSSNSLPSSTFTNIGTYEKNSEGETLVHVPFHNSGILNLNAGTLRLTQGGSMDSTGEINTGTDTSVRFLGSFDITDAAGLKGAGTFIAQDGTMDLQGTVSASQFYAVNSTLTGNHDFARFAFLTDTVWGAGHTEISSGATLNLNGHTGEVGTLLSGRSVTNQGTFNLFFGDLVLNAASSVTNLGSFVDQAFSATPNSRIYTQSGTVGTFQNQLGGTYVKQGADTTTFELPLHNSGTLQVESGTLKLLAGGLSGPTATINLSPGAVLELASDYAIDPASVVTGGGTLALSSGTLAAGGTFHSGFTMTGGVLDGDLAFGRTFAVFGGSIAADSHLTLLGESSGRWDTKAPVLLDATTLTIASGALLSWESGNIELSNGSALHVAGLLSLAGDLSVADSGSQPGLFNVTGDFRKTAGEALSVFDVPVSVSGRFEVHQGSAEIRQGGTATGATFDVWSEAHLEFSHGYTFNSGTQFNNGGSVDLTGGLFALNGHVDLGPDAAITGGTVTGTHTLGGTIHWTGATLEAGGTTTIDSGARFILDVPGDVDLARDLTVNGTLEWRDGHLHGGEGTLINAGRIEITSDGSFDNANPGTYAIINHGQFLKTGGEGTTTIDVPFANHGLVNASVGLIHFTDTFTISGGGTLGGGIKFDAPLTLPPTSTLGGNGTITGNLSTGGLVAPGNSIGSLTVDGDLTFQSTTVSFFEIDVTAVPSPVDFLSVTGTLALDGILTAEFLNGVMPGATDSFTIISAGNLTGAFANIQNGDRIHSAGFFQSWVVNYGPASPFNPHAVVFSSFEFSPVPEPSTFSLLVLGVGFLCWRTRRRRT